jgi:hypothetical protein
LRHMTVVSHTNQVLFSLLQSHLFLPWS